MSGTLYNLTYSRLKTLIHDACRQFPNYSTLFDENVDNFIAEACFRVAGDCKTLPLKINTLATQDSILGEGIYTLEKPALLYRTVFLSARGVGSNIKDLTLIKRNYSFCQYLNNQLNENLQYNLIYYCDDYNDREYYFSPVSNSSHAISISYYALPRPLESNTEENTLTRNVPDLLKSASLIGAYDFMSDLESKQREEANYAKILTRHTMTDKNRQKSDYDSDT